MDKDNKVQPTQSQPTQSQPMEYALITGATGGLGRAFAFLLAAQNRPLILTGRSEERLLALQQELQEEYAHLEVRVLAADLANEESRYAMTAQVAAWNATISLLVNVAGADVQKSFCQYTQEKLTFQCRVNFEAAADMCRFAIERKAQKLEIINISSVSGIYPMPYFALYSATKGALTSFSIALREEMKGKNVSVTAILPGAMPTREDIRQQIKGQGVWGRLAAKSPQWVAKYSLRAVRKNKRKAIPGFWNKIMRMTTAWLPLSWKLRFIAKRWSKISKDAF